MFQYSRLNSTLVHVFKVFDVSFLFANWDTLTFAKWQSYHHILQHTILYTSLSLIQHASQNIQRSHNKSVFPPQNSPICICAKG